MTTEPNAIIEIPSARGLLRRRPEQAEDEAFRFLLFRQSRPAEFAYLPLEPAALEQLTWFQFQAQTTGYRTSYPNARFDIIELERTAIGRIVVDRTGDALRIVDQAIMPPLRGRGFGTAIMQALMDEAGRCGLAVRLNVVVSNDAAIRLYLRLGFVPVATAPLHIEMEWRVAAAPPG